MTKSASKRTKRKEMEAVETEPDAWDRFTKAVGKIVPPKQPKPKEEDEETPDRRSGAVDPVRV